MDRYGRYTRRGFVSLSMLSGLFFVHLPGLEALDQLKEEVKSPLKRFFLEGSHPIMETTIRKRWIGDSLLITIEKSSLPLFRLNETSGLILEWCDGNHTPSDIAERLKVEFDVDEKMARKDVFDTLEAFYNSGLIKV